MALEAFPEGDYRYLTGIAPYCRAVVAEPGFEIVHATLRRPLLYRRGFEVVERHLAGREWMVGEAYGIVDMALWGWARMLPFVLGEGAFDGFPNLKRHHDAIASRPAAAKAVALKDRFPFKAEFDAEARSHMFKHLKPAV